MRPTRAAFIAGTSAGLAAGIPRFAGAAEFNYKLASVNPPTYPITVRAVEACDRIMRESGGRLEIKVFPFSQLGGSLDMITQVRLGSIELLLPPDADLSTAVPVAAMTTLPFIVPNRDAALKILTGDFGQYIRNAVRKAGLIPLPYSWDAGFRQIENSVRSISTPADMRGLKLRTSASAAEIGAFKAFGASPVQISTNELYSGLQTHLADGATLPMELVEPFKLYEVTKYLTRTNHLWAGQSLVINGVSHQRLPKNLQDLVQRSFEAARRASNDDLPKVSATAEEHLKAHGMTINNPDLAALRKVVRDAGLYTQWKNLYPAEAWTLLERNVGPLA